MRLQLEISTTPDSKRSFEHSRPILNIGRDSTCDLAIPDGGRVVSSKHARIEMTRDGAYLRDLGSTNGTFLNDERIDGQIQVNVGDYIRLGQNGPYLKLTTLDLSGEFKEAEQPYVPTEPQEELQHPSSAPAVQKAAHQQRDLEKFVESARGETSTSSFTHWAGDERVTLAIVFTDVVKSTSLGEELRDEHMNEVRRAHFAQSRKLIEQYKGREIKTIGDSFMAAFRSVVKALDYARALQANPGHAKVQVRAGIHIGSMTVDENDVFGGAVNFASRVVVAIKEAEIWLSERAKEDLDRSGAKQHSLLQWERHDDVAMKGFDGAFTLWALSE